MRAIINFLLNNKELVNDFKEKLEEMISVSFIGLIENIQAREIFTSSLITIISSNLLLISGCLFSVNLEFIPLITLTLGSLGLVTSLFQGYSSQRNVSLKEMAESIKITIKNLGITSDNIIDIGNSLKRQYG